MGLFGKKLSPEEMFKKALRSYDVGRYEKALPLMEKAAQEGHVKAQYHCSRMYDKGRGTAVDKARALMWLEKAAGQGDRRSQYWCGEMYENGEGTAADKAKAKMWYEKAAQQGYNRARAALDRLNGQAGQAPAAPSPAPKPQMQEAKQLFHEGMDAFLAEDYAKAFPLLEKAAAQGHAMAQNQCGVMCECGLGTAEDLDKAMMLYEKAAEQGNESAKTALAKLKAKNKPTFPAPKAEPPKPAPVQAPAKPAPAPTAQAEPQPGDDLTPEERYTKGMELFKAGDYDGAYALLHRVCRMLGAGKYTYPDGQVAMGWMYEHGRGVEAKDSVAHRHYELAAKSGDRDGIAGVVRMTAKAESPSVSACQTALEYIKQLGTEETKSLLSTVEQKLSEAQKRENAEAEQNLREEDLQQIFGEGVTAYASNDFVRALALFEKAARQGSEHAQFNCAVMYSGGLGTAVDNAKALMWLEKAARQGHPEAQYNCGVMYSNGLGTAVDNAKALMWLEKAARQGHAQAQFNCGVKYDSGLGTAVDKAKALMWFEKAAQQGDARAQCNCGVMYSKGEGTAVDKAKALMWYEKAAQQGDVTAQYYCGLKYDSGEGTAVDKAKALMWYEKAARQGDVAAQFNCGLMYFTGEGTKPDTAKAKMWFQKVAAQTENQEAQEKARKILQRHF